MNEYTKAVQCMIDWIENHIDEKKVLEKMSNDIGYSPWYCSVLFHDVTNMTLKTYVAGRKLALATEEIRDTEERILDIAVKYGYSSQEALTRSFKEQFGCTPAAYRRSPVPIPLQLHKVVLFPDYDEKRIETMERSRLSVRVEHIPAHKYMGVFEEKADNYCDFWKYQDCDEICGTVTSMEKMAHPIVTPHTAGWTCKNGKKSYFYGTGIADDYTGPVPEGFTIIEVPESDYLVFSYPAFDFMKENVEVMGAVEEMAWNFDPKIMGYEWNEDVCNDYQRHNPEKDGYQVLRPVKKA